MAFDQPLEADRVEDNLLVSLVRGPILGSLMWILGDDEEEKRQQEAELQQGLQDMVLDDIDDDDDSNNLQKTLPRLVRSDLSVTMGEQQQERNPQQDTPFFPSQERAASSDNNMLSVNRHRTERKQMSWSNNLVEYMDEVRIYS